MVAHHLLTPPLLWGLPDWLVNIVALVVVVVVVSIVVVDGSVSDIV